MSNNLQKAGSQDRSRVNVNDAWEVKHWTEALGVTKEKLEEAVKAVGRSVTAVKAHLGKRSSALQVEIRGIAKNSQNNSAIVNLRSGRVGMATAAAFEARHDNSLVLGGGAKGAWTPHDLLKELTNTRISTSGQRFLSTGLFCPRN